MSKKTVILANELACIVILISLKEVGCEYPKEPDEQAITELGETKVLCESFKNDINRLNEQCTNLHLKDKKQTQILEVLKNKAVDINLLCFSTSVEQYNHHELCKYYLTETEFNVLKEWLK